jgi:hypothetical protein
MIMKSRTLIIQCGLMAALTTQAYADATVRLNNYDSLMPVYYQRVGNLASGDDFYIEVWGGPVGSGWTTMLPIIPVGATTPTIKLKEPGYFDAGIGVIRFVFENGPVTLGVRGWYGYPTYQQAASAGLSGQSLEWGQLAGSWDPQSGLTPTGPLLEMISPLEIGYPLPEPSSLMLAILGGALILGTSWKKNAHRRQQRTLR